MKLKSKLIATIVSMCAAIAVMGVGVWASSSQRFQVTVKNDIDVKIISVDADVYGEFAVYSQFSGHTTNGETNAYAQAYHMTRTQNDSNRGTFEDRHHKDHGYLLYARSINGYNDGKGNSDATYHDDNTQWYYNNVEAEAGSAYQKYIDEAKKEVYFATAESKGIDDNDDNYDKAKNWATNNYNIDFNTHTAQIAYMYTIRQWKMASQNAASNSIELALKSSISEDTDLDLGPGHDDNNNGRYDEKSDANPNGDSARSLTKALTNANGTAGIFIDAYIARATDEDHADNNPGAGEANGVGETEDTLDWYPVDLDAGTRLPSSGINETYYIVITYTFARTGANLDLSGLANAVEHTLVMATPGKLAEAGVDIKTETPEGGGDPQLVINDYNTGDDVKLCYATGLNTSSSTEAAYHNNGYQIYGEEFVPTFSPAQITATASATTLANCFATGETDQPWLSNILNIDTDDENTLDSGMRLGYIFASNSSFMNPTDATAGSNPGNGKYIPITTEGSTGYYVKQLNDGNTVSNAWNKDSNQGSSALVG